MDHNEGSTLIVKRVKLKTTGFLPPLPNLPPTPLATITNPARNTESQIEIPHEIHSTGQLPPLPSPPGQGPPRSNPRASVITPDRNSPRSQQSSSSNGFTTGKVPRSPPSDRLKTSGLRKAVNEEDATDQQPQQKPGKLPATSHPQTDSLKMSKELHSEQVSNVGMQKSKSFDIPRWKVLRYTINTAMTKGASPTTSTTEQLPPTNTSTTHNSSPRPRSGGFKPTNIAPSTSPPHNSPTPVSLSANSGWTPSRPKIRPHSASLIGLSAEEAAPSVAPEPEKPSGRPLRTKSKSPTRQMSHVTSQSNVNPSASSPSPQATMQMSQGSRNSSQKPFLPAKPRSHVRLRSKSLDPGQNSVIKSSRGSKLSSSAKSSGRIVDLNENDADDEEDLEPNGTPETVETTTKSILRTGPRSARRDISAKLALTQEEEEQEKQRANRPKLKRKNTGWIPRDQSEAQKTIMAALVKSSGTRLEVTPGKEEPRRRSTSLGSDTSPPSRPVNLSALFTTPAKQRRVESSSEEAGDEEDSNDRDPTVGTDNHGNRNDENSGFNGNIRTETNIKVEERVESTQDAEEKSTYSLNIGNLVDFLRPDSSKKKTPRDSEEEFKSPRPHSNSSSKHFKGSWNGRLAKTRSSIALAGGWFSPRKGSNNPKSHPTETNLTASSAEHSSERHRANSVTFNSKGTHEVSRQTVNEMYIDPEVDDDDDLNHTTFKSQLPRRKSTVRKILNGVTNEPKYELQTAKMGSEPLPNSLAKTMPDLPRLSDSQSASPPIITTSSPTNSPLLSPSSSPTKSSHFGESPDTDSTERAPQGILKSGPRDKKPQLAGKPKFEISADEEQRLAERASKPRTKKRRATQWVPPDWKEQMALIDSAGLADADDTIEEIISKAKSLKQTTMTQSASGKRAAMQRSVSRDSLKSRDEVKSPRAKEGNVLKSGKITKKDTQREKPSQRESRTDVSTLLSSSSSPLISSRANLKSSAPGSSSAGGGLRQLYRKERSNTDVEGEPPNVVSSLGGEVNNIGDGTEDNGQEGKLGVRWTKGETKHERNSTTEYSPMATKLRNRRSDRRQNYNYHPPETPDSSSSSPSSLGSSTITTTKVSPVSSPRTTSRPKSVPVQSSAIASHFSPWNSSAMKDKQGEL